MRGSTLALAVALAACAAAPPPTLTLVAGGDVILHRPATPDRPARDVGSEAPFERLAAFFFEADLVLVNLEQPLCDVPPTDLRGDAPVRLYAPRERAADLAVAGIDVVSLANNHALDCGAAGLDTTVDTLASVGIAAAGVSRGDLDPWAPLLVDLEVDDADVRVAIVSATLVAPRLWDAPPSAWPLAVTTYDDAAHDLGVAIDRARVTAPDVIVVSLHWGVEGAGRPRPEQRSLAERLADAGADLIIGHGPHVAQPVETAANGTTVIAYSLGNLVFDGTTAAERAGLIVEVTWSGARLGEGRSEAPTLRVHRVEQPAGDEPPP